MYQRDLVQKECVSPFNYQLQLKWSESDDCSLVAFIVVPVVVNPV